MNINFKSTPKQYKTLLNGYLIVATYVSNKIQFNIFNQNQQETLHKTQYFSYELLDQIQDQNHHKVLFNFFQDFQDHPQQFLTIQKNKLFLKIIFDQQEKPLLKTLSLKLEPLSPKQSVFYLKQFSIVKDKAHKEEILKLKSQIYSQMIELEDASTLIKSHSYQSKKSKQQIKTLKKQLKTLQQEKKKYQQTSFAEVGIQHDFQSVITDSIQCLETPGAHQFLLDKEQIRVLTEIIQQQIIENENILSRNNKAIPNKNKQTVIHRALSESSLPEYEEITCQKVKMSPQTVSLIQKTDLAVGLDNNFTSFRLP